MKNMRDIRIMADRVMIDREYYDALVKFHDAANEQIDLLNQQITLLNGINDSLEESNKDLKKRSENYEKIFIDIIAEALKKSKADSVDDNEDNKPQDEITESE